MAKEKFERTKPHRRTLATVDAHRHIARFRKVVEPAHRHHPRAYRFALATLDALGRIE